VTEIQDVNWLVIHSSATPPSMNVTEEMIDEWHRAKGWDSIGYHVFIRRDGTVEFGRPFDVRGAHVLGHNNDSIGICMAGGVSEDGEPEDNFISAQHHSLLRVLDALKMLFPMARARGHRDFDSADTACPSFDVEWWLNTQARGHYYG